MTSTESLANSPAETLPPAPVRDTAREESGRTVALLAPPAEGNAPVTPGSRRRPGRPLEMSPEELLQTVRQLSASKDGLFRVHVSAPGLYARARRLFGSWSAAVRLAGVDYELYQGMARARSLQTRRRNRRRPRTP